MFGESQAELSEIFKAVNPKTIADSRDRAQLEAIQELSDIELPTRPAITEDPFLAHEGE